MTRRFQPLKDLVEECLRRRISKHQKDGSDLGLFKEEHGGSDVSEREGSRVDLREWESKVRWVK